MSSSYSQWINKYSSILSTNMMNSDIREVCYFLLKTTSFYPQFKKENFKIKKVKNQIKMCQNLIRIGWYQIKISQNYIRICQIKINYYQIENDAINLKYAKFNFKWIKIILEKKIQNKINQAIQTN